MQAYERFVHLARLIVDSEGAILRGVRDQLGLALKAGHSAIDVLVVDHVERTPAQN